MEMVKVKEEMIDGDRTSIDTLVHEGKITKKNYLHMNGMNF